MKKIILAVIYIAIVNITIAQEVIKIPYTNTTDVIWEGGEKEYFTEIWNTQVVTNVSIPTMEVFRPKNPNGTAVIIAPGGALYALSIFNEGIDAAKWLNKKGITAFVLKYRLVPTGEDAIQQYYDDGKNGPELINKKVANVLALSIADGLSAIKYIRENASKYTIDSHKIGFMGFSAGGAVTMGVAYNYEKNSRPDFIVPVYPWTRVIAVQEVPNDAPPMLVICATDDPLDLASGSVDLYSSWLKAKKTAGLHMYSKGGHGFGMRKQNLPSDTWISRFYDWSIAEKITTIVDNK